MDLFRPFFLLLLVHWTAAVVDQSSQCEQNIHHESKINTILSRNKNASVTVLDATNASSAEECGQQCCNHGSGNCSIAQYSVSIMINNCMLVSCHPVSACILSPRTTVHSMVVSRQVSNDGQSSSHSNIITTTTMPSTTVQTENEASNQQDSKPISTTAKQMSSPNADIYTTIPTTAPDGLTVQTADISELNEILGDDPSSSENDGANKETSTTNVLSTSLDADKSKNSKGKKGAVLLPNVSSEKSTTNEKVQVVEEELKNADNSSLEILSNPTTSVASTTKMPTATQTDAITETIKTSVVTTSSAAVLSTQVPSSAAAVTTSKKKELTSTSTTALFTSSRPTELPIDSPNVTEAVQNLTNVNTTSTTTQHSTSNSSALETTEEPTSDIDEFKVRAKFHLVIALVLGLMLLITVVGLVLRRVHDVWLRRHYQRMDFLIDGMYNNVNS